MTKDEILLMSAGHEMNKLIAEHVFGMRLEKNHGLAGGFYWVGNGVQFGQVQAHNVPEYSTDIEAAWVVAEKIGIGMLNNVHGIWECYVGNVVGKSKSVTHAICRAALLYVMEK